MCVHVFVCVCVHVFVCVCVYVCVCVCVSSLDKEEAIPLQRHSSFRLSEKKRPADPVQSFRANKRTEG